MTAFFALYAAVSFVVGTCGVLDSRADAMKLHQQMGIGLILALLWPAIFVAVLAIRIHRISKGLGQ